MNREPQLLQAAAALKSALAALQRLAAGHPDASARPAFGNQERRLRTMLDRLENRLRERHGPERAPGGPKP